MSLLLTALAVKKFRAQRRAAFYYGAAVGIAKFATLTALPIAVALGAGAASRCAAKRGANANGADAATGAEGEAA